MSEINPRYVMPGEFAEHDATWMIFPPSVYEGALSLDDARAAWCDVARAISRFEPVQLLTRANDIAAAQDLLADTVTYVDATLDDAWARDVAPTFVFDDARELVGIDWTFNGWGAQPWAKWQNDDMLAREIARHLNISTYRSSLVNEGGGIEVDGAGRVILTDTVQLDPHRNPAMSRQDVEDEISRLLGVDSVTWLVRGLNGDYGEFGTRGHVDLLVKFIAPGVAIYHDQQNPEHPDFVVSQQIREVLERADIEATGVVAPARVSHNGRLCDWSYINCYFTNGGLVAGIYDDPADDAALKVLASVMTQREIVTVDARALFALGGGVHCITQQQPR